jgi:hypothetical protein
MGDTSCDVVLRSDGWIIYSMLEWHQVAAPNRPRPHRVTKERLKNPWPRKRFGLDRTDGTEDWTYICVSKSKSNANSPGEYACVHARDCLGRRNYWLDSPVGFEHCLTAVSVIQIYPGRSKHLAQGTCPLILLSWYLSLLHRSRMLLVQPSNLRYITLHQLRLEVRHHSITKS